MRAEDDVQLWIQVFRELATEKGATSQQLIQHWKRQHFSPEELVPVLNSIADLCSRPVKRKSDINWLNLTRLYNYLYLRHRNFELWLFCELAGNAFFKPRLHHITSIRAKSISEIPENIDRFFNLRRLYSYGGKYDLEAGNVLAALPENIGKCRQLRSIQILHHRLQELPKSIGQLGELRELVLYHNQLKTLPENIGNLQKLEYLDLSGNQITHLPETIGNLPADCFISLRGNPLEVFPETIQMMEITTAQWNRHQEAIVASEYLKYCRIYYSKELDIKDLFSLDLSVDIGLVFLSGTITEFPEELRGLENLRYLYIDGCPVKLPSWFAEFQRLESLHLIETDGGEFPEEVFACQNLLDLSLCTNFSNPVTKIPEDIGKLQRLETLNLKENHIKELPNSLWSLRHLEELDLSMNGFSGAISGEVLKLKKLRMLNLKYNPMEKKELKILRSYLKRGLFY